MAGAAFYERSPGVSCLSWVFPELEVQQVANKLSAQGAGFDREGITDGDRPRQPVRFTGGLDTGLVKLPYETTVAVLEPAALEHQLRVTVLQVCPNRTVLQV